MFFLSLFRNLKDAPNQLTKLHHKHTHHSDHELAKESSTLRSGDARKTMTHLVSSIEDIPLNAVAWWSNLWPLAVQLPSEATDHTKQQINH